MPIPNVAGVSILTDCMDDNALQRQHARCSRLLGCGPVITAISPGEVGLREAGSTLVDILDAAYVPIGSADAGPYVVIINAAERGNPKWDNGVPFGYFHDRGTCTLVITTLSETVLESAVRHDRVRELHLLDIPTVMKWAVANRKIPHNKADEIIDSQFRSLAFVPLVAQWLMESGDEVPSKPYPLRPPGSVTGNVHRVDSFGNLVTDIPAPQAEGLTLGTPGVVTLVDGQRLPYYPRLADARPGDLVAVRSSSGYGSRKVLMVCVVGLGGPSAAEKLGKKLGDPLIEPAFARGMIHR